MQEQKRGDPWIGMHLVCSSPGSQTQSPCWEKCFTSFDVSRGGGELEGSRRFHSSSDALQQGEERVPVVCTVDVGCVGLQQLMEAVRHLSADPGQHMRFHHKQETQGVENLWVYKERDDQAGI